jgi:nitroimidazol reductase NimA-like FMN-containing flavoprotein (pyridoxamine 5'-phosphate oxidase superfamily)
MPFSVSEVSAQIKAILQKTRFGVLATDQKGAPYTTLVAFAVDKKLKNFYFITSKNTRKFYNIQKNNKVSLLIDDRDMHPGQTFRITAITVTGFAEIVSRPSKKVVNSYISKYPELEEFSKSEATMFLQVKTEKLILVTRFQEVIELDI